MGLAALALEGNPVFPTYPNRMPQADVSAGLVLPNAAVAMLGKGGAGATLLLIFMAVTSATSAELIAVSSIWTYDIYQHYINPQVRMKSANPLSTRVQMSDQVLFRLQENISSECRMPHALDIQFSWPPFPWVCFMLASAWAGSTSSWASSSPRLCSLRR
jgi:hypothetical protein